VPAGGTGDKTVSVRPVKIVRDDGNVVRVTGAITANDTVIDSPPDAIHTGMTVHVAQILKPAADMSTKPGTSGAPNAK